MAEDSWAQAVDLQESGGISASVKSLSLRPAKEIPRASSSPPPPPPPSSSSPPPPQPPSSSPPPPSSSPPPPQPSPSSSTSSVKSASTAATAAAVSVSTTAGTESAVPDVNGSEVKPQSTTEDDEDKADSAEVSLLNKMIRTNLLVTEQDVEVKQRDPNSPLYSVKSFQELYLKSNLLQGVHKMGFNRPSRIQESALPMMLADPPQNLIAQSQSGTGKTAAFVLAMLSRINPDLNYPQCLCVSPTYELALQTGSVITQMGQFCPEIRLAYAVRGNRVERGVRCEDHIVIGTPGTLLDWCSKLRVVDPRRVRVFVLDEADVMIATQGHKEQSIRIQRMLPPDCQMLLFSATFEDSVWAFATKVVPEPNVIRLRRDEETLDNIRQLYIACDAQEDKFHAISNIYGAITIAQAMIFCHTRRTAGWLAARLTQEGHRGAMLSLCVSLCV
ncbi:ATP-dependent RNA helicase DDX19A-like isoform X6 [Petromyzon marinus]|uniref:ATP-dependent RNA helicase DDX19A-like isoform X5 n=1 Tax=Petromyzon marinus TaxID=7757 RepID=UPI003F6E83EC